MSNCVGCEEKPMSDEPVEDKCPRCERALVTPNEKWLKLCHPCHALQRDQRRKDDERPLIDFP